MKRRGQGKGSSFERRVCKMLSEWWQPGNDAIFWRTSCSGGRSTVRGRKGKKTVNQAGDICATDPIGQPFLDCFAVEVKRGYPTATVHDLLDTKNPIYAKWIEQAEASRVASGAEWWMILHQRDRRETIVTVSRDAYIYLGDGCPGGNVLTFDSKLIEIRSLTLSNFLRGYTPQDCIRYAEVRKRR